MALRFPRTPGRSTRRRRRRDRRARSPGHSSRSARVKPCTSSRLGVPSRRRGSPSAGNAGQRAGGTIAPMKRDDGRASVESAADVDIPAVGADDDNVSVNHPLERTVARRHATVRDGSREARNEECDRDAHGPGLDALPSERARPARSRSADLPRPGPRDAALGRRADRADRARLSPHEDQGRRRRGRRGARCARDREANAHLAARAGLPRRDDAHDDRLPRRQHRARAVLQRPARGADDPHPRGRLDEHECARAVDALSRAAPRLDGRHLRRERARGARHPARSRSRDRCVRRACSREAT